METPKITLTTDFGTSDPDLGRLKGAILQQIPRARLIDISHDITPFQPDEATYVVKNALAGFPAGTIHLIGFESETHSTQKPLLSIVDNQYFLSNDNGIVATAFSDKNPEHYWLPFQNNSRFMQTHIQAASNLTSGNLPEKIPAPKASVKHLQLTKPMEKTDKNTGKIQFIVPKVIYNDHYGNAVLNIKKEYFQQLKQGRTFVIKTGAYKIDKIETDYIRNLHNDDFILDGKMFARFNDYGYLEIYIYKSNRVTGGADTLLGLQKNQTVVIEFDV